MDALLAQCLRVTLGCGEQPPDLAPGVVDPDVARECEREFDTACHPPRAHDDHGCWPHALVIVHVGDVLPGGRHAQRPEACEVLEAEAVLERMRADAALASARVHLDGVLDDVAGSLAEGPQVLLARPGEVLIDRTITSLPQRRGHAAHEVDGEGDGLEAPVSHREVLPRAPQGATNAPC